jgi:hypothetical protein
MHISCSSSSSPSTSYSLHIYIGQAVNLPLMDVEDDRVTLSSFFYAFVTYLLHYQVCFLFDFFISIYLLIFVLGHSSFYCILFSHLSFLLLLPLLFMKSIFLFLSQWQKHWAAQVNIIDLFLSSSNVVEGWYILYCLYIYCVCVCLFRMFWM